MTIDWQPSASIETLHKRADILASIRAFFAQRNVLEVETPSLSAHTITDPHLQALHTLHTEPGASHSRTMYLQTSPEYAMKRLLAFGSGDIYQLCKAYRDDEVGRLHNPEFTMLEWYRVGFSMQKLIDEVAALLKALINLNVEQYTYAELFQRHCGFNPLNASLSEIKQCCEQYSLGDYISSIENAYSFSEQNKADNNLVRDAALQVLFSQQIENKIGQQKATIVTHFPASQASLATLAENGLTAHRFEVYYQGIELANGFHELQDPQIQEQRFISDNQKRAAMGLAEMPIDTYFLAAMKAGLPACAGVALGVDRLIMLILNLPHIKQVLSFNHANC